MVKKAQNTPDWLGKYTQMGHTVLTLYRSVWLEYLKVKCCKLHSGDGFSSFVNINHVMFEITHVSPW